jgi:DNA processing protein
MQNTASFSLATQVLTLARMPEMTPRLFDALLQRFGTLERLYHADSGAIMAIQGMTPKIANLVSNASSKLQDTVEFQKSLELIEINVATRFDDNFAESLRELHDPPLALYYRGTLPDTAQKSVSLVTPADSSSEGIAFTTKAARQFATSGVQVIAPLTGGGPAHLGAKAGGGKSFAVLDSGIMHIHPPENISLAIDIAKDGGVISEYAPETPYAELRYAETNRLLAALPQAVVVTGIHENAADIHDLLLCCSQIGKLCFLLIDPQNKSLIDEKGFHAASVHGAIPILGLEKLDQIVQSLV